MKYNIKKAGDRKVWQIVILFHKYHFMVLTFSKKSVHSNITIQSGKKMTRLIFGLLLTLSIITNQLLAEDLCYKADKNDFNHTTGKSHDVIFDLSDLKEKNLIHLSFSSLYPIPYGDSIYSFYCIKEENSTNQYECSGDCDSGKMSLKISDYDLSVNVHNAILTNTPDDPIFHGIRSKENKFTRTHRTVCPKDHTFRNKVEKHLPFVCYTWKEKSLYHGCTRHHDSCKSIKAEHFGKYPNDYAAHQAFQRCENSTPRATPNTNVTKVPKPLIKSKQKKEKLLGSINIKDVAIYDLDYHNELVIAVGEDDSARTRKLRSMDEHHESVILRSIDYGKNWYKVGKEVESSMPHNEVIVLDDQRIVIASSMEGAGGQIILSEDAGETWEVRYNEAFIVSMKHLHGDTLIAKTFGPTIKSIDGGKNWVEIPSQ